MVVTLWRLRGCFQSGASTRHEHCLGCFRAFGKVSSRKHATAPTRSDKDGSGGGEVRLVSGRGGSLELRKLGEAKRLLGELRNSGGGLVELVVLEADGLDDVDALMTATVATGELLVHLGDGAAKGDITVLLVHVNVVLTGKVLEHDAVVLDGGGGALEDLAHGDDLTLDLANLVLSLHLIPELGASDHGVLGEHSDSVAGGLGVLRSGSLSADNPVLLDL